jgi:hypothetical protein
MFGEVVQDRAKRAQRDVGWIGSEMTVAVVEQPELSNPMEIAYAASSAEVKII